MLNTVYIARYGCRVEQGEVGTGGGREPVVEGDVAAKGGDFMIPRRRKKDTYNLY